MTNLSIPRVLALLLVLIGFAVPMTAAHADIEYKYNGGPCTGSDLGAYANWYSVTTYSNGRATAVFGRGCDGKYYSYDICSVNTSSDPMGIGPITHTGVCNASATWNCKIVYDSNNVPIWIGGQDCLGQYYVDAAVQVTCGDERGPGSALE